MREFGNVLWWQDRDELADWEIGAIIGHAQDALNAGGLSGEFDVTVVLGPAVRGGQHPVGWYAVEKP